MSEALEFNSDSIVAAEPQDRVHYAGFWIRVAAALMDAIVLWAVNSLVEIMSLPTIFQAGSVAQGKLIYQITV